MQWAIVAALASASTLLASGLFAQEPTVSIFTPVRTLTPPLVTPPGEPSLGGSDLSPQIAVAPLRLSLTGSVFPQARGLGDGCENGEPTIANSVNGFPLQRYTLLRLTPHLVLHGFSVGGCPLDAGMGGAATQVVPLRRDAWLVASAGVYAAPGQSAFRASARVDVFKRTANDRVFNVGVGRIGDRRGLWGLSFGGTW